MSAKAVILFDGVCNLCNASVQFVLLRDKKDYFQFASLQSDYGQQLLQKHNLPTQNFDSFVLVENNVVYSQSTAALRVAKYLSGAWKLMYAFIIVPSFLRNIVYNFIGKNRYKWFGKQEECMMPKPEWKQKFLS
jgi:predicted DCC family thiol-disulfide oxidoreductase YuxK